MKGATLTACLSSSSTDAESSDSDSTSARPDAVPPYTDEDKAFDYGARVRVSYAGGPVSESDEAASTAAARRRRCRGSWASGVGSVPTGRALFLAFGPAKAKTFDDDAMIFEADRDAPGRAFLRAARARATSSSTASWPGD